MHTSRTDRGILRLADHVRGCAIDGQVILLDLRRNKYVGIGGDQSQALAHAIDGWPAMSVATAAMDADARSIDVEAFVRPLLDQGLVQRTPTPSSPAARRQTPALKEATRSLHAEDSVPRPRTGWLRLARVLHASTATAIQLRTRSLATIARATAARSGARVGPPFEPLQEAVAAYLKLRLYVFTAHDQCLHDSLTLHRFLASEGMSARWVIGVRTHPFGAHSWLQTDETVVNDLHENVRGYRPILVV